MRKYVTWKAKTTTNALPFISVKYRLTDQLKTLKRFSHPFTKILLPFNGLSKPFKHLSPLFKKYKTHLTFQTNCLNTLIIRLQKFCIRLTIWAKRLNDFHVHLIEASIRLTFQAKVQTVNFQVKHEALVSSRRA